MPTEQDVLKALSVIIDPDFKKDIVSLGFVKNISIQSGQIKFDIDLTTPACPVKSEFQRQAEEIVGRLKGVKAVAVNMTSSVRPRPGPIANIPNTLKGVKSIIAVSSAKGGVGKSTVAACLALELAHRGFKVGLLDADLHGPSVPTLFELTHVSVYANAENQLLPVEALGLKLMSFGFLLGDAPAVMRGPIVSRYTQQLLQTTLWGELDYLFIDMPPGTGDVQLTITQTIPLSGAVIITTRQSLSLVDVSRGILMFEKVAVPILGIIENMAYFICDHCQKKHYIFGGSKGGQMEERFGIPTLAEIPLLPSLTARLHGPIDNPIIKEAVDKVVMSLGKLSLETPQVPQIKIDDHCVYLTWQDGKKIKIRHRDLRLSCRCALCVNEISGEKILKERDVSADIAPKEVFPLGNYALGINWNDGHTSGIYPYKTIEEIGVKNQDG